MQEHDFKNLVQYRWWKNPYIEYKAMFEYILYVCVSLEPYSYLQNYLNLKIYGTPTSRMIFFYSNTFFL